MPRAGLVPASVTEAAAVLVDEVGFDQLSMGVVAERLGVKTPSLYKHVDSLADLGHRIAVLAAVELGDALRDATQGRADHDALTAAVQAVRTYARRHPGRYAALNNSRLTGYDDPLVAARGRLLDPLAAVLHGYRLDPSQEIHALRMLRSTMYGFVTLEAADGFQIDTDTDDSFRLNRQLHRPRAACPGRDSPARHAGPGPAAFAPVSTAGGPGHNDARGALRFLGELVAWVAVPWALWPHSPVLAIGSVLVLIGLPAVFGTPGDRPGGGTRGSARHRDDSPRAHPAHRRYDSSVDALAVVGSRSSDRAVPDRARHRTTALAPPCPRWWVKKIGRPAVTLGEGGDHD